MKYVENFIFSLVAKTAGKRWKSKSWKFYICHFNVFKKVCFLLLKSIFWRFTFSKYFRYCFCKKWVFLQISPWRRKLNLKKFHCRKSEFSRSFLQCSWSWCWAGDLNSYGWTCRKTHFFKNEILILKFQSSELWRKLQANDEKVSLGNFTFVISIFSKNINPHRLFQCGRSTKRMAPNLDENPPGNAGNAASPKTFSLEGMTVKVESVMFLFVTEPEWTPCRFKETTTTTRAHRKGEVFQSQSFPEQMSFNLIYQFWPGQYHHAPSSEANELPLQVLTRTEPDFSRMRLFVRCRTIICWRIDYQQLAGSVLNVAVKGATGAIPNWSNVKFLQESLEVWAILFWPRASRKMRAAVSARSLSTRMMRSGRVKRPHEPSNKPNELLLHLFSEKHFFSNFVEGTSWFLVGNENFFKVQIQIIQNQFFP